MPNGSVSAVRRPAPSFGDATGVWLVGLAFALGIGVSAVPTPLYTLYAARDGFGPGTTTLVFAGFSAAVSATLVLLGPVSDWTGRRRALVPALLLDAGSCALFLAWPVVPGLIVARVVCGISVGIIAATATAYMAELHARAAPRRLLPRVEILATAANLGGVGIGALVAGLLAQYAPHPLRLPYELYLALLLVVTALVARLPGGGVPPARPSRPVGGVRVPTVGRRRYVSAAAGALLAMTTLGLFASLVPTFLTDVLHRDSHALAGAMTFIVFLSATLSQTLLGRLGPRPAMAGGCLGMALGLAMMTVALWAAQLPLFVSGGVAAGAGAGLVFKRCLADAAELAPARARAQSLAGVYLAAYLGLAVAILGLGMATSAIGDRVAMLVFAAVSCVGVGTLALERVAATRTQPAAPL